MEAIPGLFAVVVIFLLTRFVIRIVDAFFVAVEKDVVKLSMLQPDTARATRRITTALIWIFALTVAYQYIPGSNTDAFRAIGVLAGADDLAGLGRPGEPAHERPRRDLLARPAARRVRPGRRHCGGS